MKTVLKICVLLLFFNLPAQNLQWGFSIGGSDIQYSRSMRLHNGVLVCTGFFENSFDADPGPAVHTLTSNGLSDFFLIRYDTDGNFLSGFSIGGTGAESGRNDVCLDPFGNIYASVRFQNTVDADPGAGTASHTATGPVSSVTIKFDSAGNYISSFQLEVDTYGLFADSNHLYLVGGFNGTVDFDPGIGTSNETVTARGLFTAKYTNSGALNWVLSVENTALTGSMTNVRVNASGEIYVAGFFGGTNIDFDPGATSALMSSNSSLFDIFLAKYDSSGNYLWSNHTGGVIDNVPYAMEFYGNDIIVGGYVQGNVDLDPGVGIQNYFADQGDAYLARFDPGGNLVWARAWGNDQYEDVISFAVTPDNDLVVTGGFSSDTMDIDPGAGVQKVYTPLDDMNGFDAYISLFDGNGNYKWSTVFGDSSWDQGNSVIADQYNNWYLSARFGKVDVDIDPSAEEFMIATTDVHDNAFFKLSPCERMNPQIAANLQLKEDAAFSIPCVVSVGTPQAYQWYKENILVTGETNSTFAFSQLAFSDQGVYKVKVTDECMNNKWSDALLLTVIPVIKVYELVSPNEDGQNDFFSIRNIDKFAFHDITIFNRWGQKVFTSTNYSNDWNGSDLPDGTYFYKIIVDKEEYKGSLLIKR